MVIRYILYGFAGWCIEVFWTGIGSLLSGDINLRGWTYLWMFPIYGLAILLEPIHDRIRHLPIFTRGVLYTLVIFMIEYSTGMLLKGALGTCPWDYSDSPFSISGLIRLDYAPAWFAAGLIFERFHDTIVSIQYLKKA